MIFVTKKYINFVNIFFNTEKEMRFSVFQQNMKMIEILNKEEQGTAFYGLTKFADLTGLFLKNKIKRKSLIHRC